MADKYSRSTKYPNVYETDYGYRVFYYLNHKKKSKRLTRTTFETNITAKKAFLVQQQLQKEAENSFVTVQDSSLTLAELISKYIETNIYDPLQDLEDSTNEGYKQKLATIMKWEIASLPVQEITTEILTDHFRTLSENYQNSYVRKLQTQLYNVFKTAVKQKKVTANPMDSVPRAKIRKSNQNKIHRPIHPKLLSDLKKKSQEYPLWQECLMWTSIHTGMRLQEILGLQWDAFKFNETKPIVAVKKSVSKQLKIKDYTKSQSGIRNIPLDIDYINFLKEYRQEQQKLFGSKWSEQTFLFSRDENILLSHKNLQTALSTIGKAVDKNLSVTNTWLRHGYSCMLILAGVPLPKIQEYMGHRKLSTTIETYTNVMPPTFLEDSVKIGAAMNGNFSTATYESVTSKPGFKFQEI
jgi:site-specific recombinase XerD